MARFVFEFQAVLRVREHEERARQKDLAVLERQRTELEDRLRSLREQMLGDRGEVARLSSGGEVDVRALRAQAASAMQSRAQAEQTAVALAGVLAKIEPARAALLKAAAARRSMELLRDRRLEAFRRAELKREALELDDLSSGRVARAAAGDEVTSGVGL